MKSIKTKIDGIVPFPLLLIIFFISIDLLIFYSTDLIFEFTEFFFIKSELFLNDIQTFFSFLMGKLISLIIIRIFLKSYSYKLGSSDSSHNISYKKFWKFIIISITFMVVLKHDIVFIFTNLVSEIKVNLIYWPDPIFTPNNYHISYLILFTLIFLIIQPLWEELIFRQILISLLIKKGFNQNYAIILSSFLFSLYLAFYILIEISINDLSWFLITSFSSGILLGLIYAKTRRIRYSFLISSLSNLFLLLLYLSKEYFEFVPYRDFILIFSFLLVLFTVYIISYYIIKIFQDEGFSISLLKRIINSSLLISWPKSSKMKDYWFKIFIILPIVPFGGIIFIKHLILFTDIWAKLIQFFLIFILLVLLIYYCYSQIQLQMIQYKKIEINTIIINISTISTKIKSFNKETLKNFQRDLFSRMLMIVVLIGIISPFYVLSVYSITRIEIIILWQALVDVKIFIAQNPFFTFQQIINEIRSNIIFIGNTTEIINQFLPFQQSLGHWNFLPDTYMASKADWIHGLTTVIIWFGILLLCIYIIRKGNKFSLRAALALVLLIIMNFFWVLLALGFGSVSEQGGPSPIPDLNQTSILLQFNITIKEFLFLPIGLVILLIGAFLIVLQFFYIKRKLERHKENNLI